jgi:hypothetical protein
MMKRIGELNKENARLKAEVEQLEAFATRTIIPNEVLQAQVERLTKAGDNLERVLVSRYGSYEAGNASHEWQSAKNYKPSV